MIISKLLFYKEKNYLFTEIVGSNNK